MRFAEFERESGLIVLNLRNRPERRSPLTRPGSTLTPAPATSALQSP